MDPGYEQNTPAPTVVALLKMALFAGAMLLCVGYWLEVVIGQRMVHQAN